MRYDAEQTPSPKSPNGWGINRRLRSARRSSGIPAKVPAVTEHIRLGSHPENSKELHPIVREEGFAIAREAITNAFRHAHASDIEVEITYAEALLGLR